jgi:hypothetical protein
MGQALAFTVEVLDASHHTPHRIADFARLQPAIGAAKRALDDPRVTVAIVKNSEGVMVYAADNRAREWIANREQPRIWVDTHPIFEPEPIPDEEPQPAARSYKWDALLFLGLFLLAAWIELPT